MELDTVEGDGEEDDGGGGQPKSHLSQLEILQCELCSFVTHWQDKLALHRRSHEVAQEWSEVKCDHCQYNYAYNPGQARSTRRAQQQLNCHMNEEQCPPLSLVQECPGLALIGREDHSVAMPALICHKEPAGASKAP